MKKRLKKIVAIISAVAITFTVAAPAMAASIDSWYSVGTWYRPYQGTASFQRTNVQGYNMKWSASQLANFESGHCWELEFRTYNGSDTAAVHPNTIYDVASGANLVSSLPNAYYEFSNNEPDDVSIGTHGCTNLVADRAYNGVLYLTAKSGTIGTNYKALIETELGYWALLDGLPLRYAQLEKINIGTSKTWSNA